MRKHSGGDQVFRITGAAAGLSEDVRGRQRRYVISMGVRTLCVIAAIVLWNVSAPLAWLALIGGAVLPYIAVVVANAGRENAPGLPSSLVRPQLPPPSRPRVSSPPPPPADEDDHQRPA